MSAARKFDRVAMDYYPTPPEVVDAIQPFLPAAETVLDPCCGVGEILARFNCHGIGIELDAGRSDAAHRAGIEAHQGDALMVDWPDADLCVFNPPFTSILDFARKAIAWRKPRATVAMLARLTFIESAERGPFHREHPADVFVLSRRPRFRGDTNGTDSVTAAWFVWGPGRGGRWQVL